MCAGNCIHGSPSAWMIIGLSLLSANSNLTS